MRAPHPSLQRLFRLAAAPAQRAQAWRSHGAALAALEAVVDDQAAASDARIQALLGEPQVGSVLAVPLARLEATGQGVEVEVPAPARQRLNERSHGGSPAVDSSAAPTRPPGAAQRPVGMPPPTGAAARRRPASAAAQAGNATPLPVGARLVPSARREPTKPDAPGSVVPSPGSSRVAAPAAARAAAGRAIDATAAAAHFEARAVKVGAAQAWQQAVDPRPMGTFAPHSATAPGTARAPSGGSARGTGVPVSAPEATAATQHVEQALARLAAESSLHPSMSAPVRATAAARIVAASREAAGASVAAAGSAPAPTGSPLHAARVGGFKGLAALGRVAGPATGPVGAASAVAIQGAPRAQPPELDPQAVIDHVENALREQAARGGISIEGLEP